jgi:hypothetical protein
MYSKLFTILAVAGLAQAKVYERSQPEHQDMYDTRDKVAQTTADAELLDVRVSVMETTQEYTAVGVKLSAFTIARIDGVVAKVGAVKSEIDRVMLAQGQKVDNTVSYDDWIAYDQSFKAAGAAATDAAAAATKALGDLELDSARKIADELTVFEATVDDAMDALRADVADAVEEAGSWSTFLRTDEHIEQVVGFKPDDIEKYWDGKVVTSTSNQGYVRGRKFYRVMFNAHTPGYWSANSDEIFMACTALSIHLRRQDGIERDLRPPCNHWGHWKAGGLGQCIMIEHSYFSHCGGGGYWEQNTACGGVPETYLRYTIGYEENRHNRDRHLSHNDGSNWHDWRDSQVSSAWKYAMCTGGNQNFKL